MNRQAVLILVFVACVIAVPIKAQADTWCNSTYPPDPPSCHCDAIFCDDMDRSLCVNKPACPPPPPMPCTDSTWSWMLVRQAWPRISALNDNPASPCGIEFKPDEDYRLFSSMPLGLRHPKGDLGQAAVDLTGDIKYTFGDQYDAVTGTDAHPLVLRYDVSGGVAADLHVQWDIGVMGLSLDTGNPNQNRPPMDYVLVGVEEDPINNPGCISCYNTCEPPQEPSVHSPWPFVCQSYETRAECPPLQTNVRTAIAVGVNALLDNNPCHCEDSNNQKPSNYYLSLYDGLKWRILHPDHPGPEGETAQWTTTYPGKYFVMGAKISTVTMIIKTNTIDVTMYAKNTPLGGGVYEAVTSTVTGLKREYLGPFNRLLAGNSIGCELSNSSYTCTGNRHCIHLGYDRCDGLGKTELGTRWLEYDGVAVSDGVPYTQDGACCLETACQSMLPDACAAAGGYFAGSSTVCEPSTCLGACCAPDSTCTETLPFAACAGTYQGPGTSCATVDCPCPTPFADVDVDGDVDMDDFSILQRCITIGSTGGDALGDVCACLDRDNGGAGDGDIDADDVFAFEACASGPNVTPTGCQ